MAVAGVIILIVAGFAVICTVIFAWALYTLLFKTKEYSPDDLVKNQNQLSFPLHVKVNAKVEYNPLISCIEKEPCFSYSSTITYHYDQMQEVSRPIHRDEGGYLRGGGIEKRITEHSIEIFRERQVVPSFSLIGPEGSSVIVDTADCPVVETGTIGRVCYTETRNGCNSSYHVLKDTSVKGFEYHVKRELPNPYRKAHFELAEKWARNTELTVYGLAHNENGVITIKTMDTCFGKRMILTDWSIQKHDGIGICFAVFCLILSLVTIPLGLVFVLK